MTKHAKHFAEQLNKCLDDSGAPANIRERAIVFSKMLNLTKQQARSLLEGQSLPDANLIQQLVDEFEVDPSHFD